MIDVSFARLIRRIPSISLPPSLSRIYPSMEDRSSLIENPWRVGKKEREREMKDKKGRFTYHRVYRAAEEAGREGGEGVRNESLATYPRPPLLIEWLRRRRSSGGGEGGGKEARRNGEGGREGARVAARAAFDI